MSSDHPEPIGPWPRIARTTPVHQTSATEVRSWEVFSNDDWLVLNKDGRLPCHPAKEGPWSCLSSAVREAYGLAQAHLVFRLDRETSGLVLFARHATAASRLQRLAERHRYTKTYLTLLRGELAGVLTVDQPLGPDRTTRVQVKSTVIPSGEGAQRAVTHFEPLRVGQGHTLARVRTETGRKHQIRAHAEWAGYPLVGDKIYGGDPELFLRFVAEGWTPALAEKLGHWRQALHCESIDLAPGGIPVQWRAPWPADLDAYVREHLGWTGGAESLQRG